MSGMDTFTELFGKVTIGTVAQVIVAGLFLYATYKKVNEYLVGRYKAEKKKNDQLEEALTAVRKYPEYRAQSIEIQKTLEEQIGTLKDGLTAIEARLSQMDEDQKRRKCNELRDRLLQSYRYYTSLEHNPLQSWTRMEYESFSGLFRDYEEMGGNGYMHSDVQPAMNRLNIIEMDDQDGVAHLMHERK